MSNIPPDQDYNDYNDYDESYQQYDQSYEDNPPAGSTRPLAPPIPPANPATPARRPIPADDMPPVYPKPSLSRREQARPMPPQSPQPPQPSQGQPRRPAPPPAYYREDTPPRGNVDRRQQRQQRQQRSQLQPGQPGYQQRPRSQPVDRSRSGLYLPWWSLVIMLAFVGCAAVGALFVVDQMGGGIPPDSETPMIIVITSTFTAGPPASPTPLPQQATLTATRPLPTIPPTLTLPPGDFAIGEFVMVIGVGESGLNIRSGPGTDSTIKFRASDGENFVLRDGPQQASGDEWWQIEAPNDSTRSGWASRRYLAITSQVVPTDTPAP